MKLGVRSQHVFAAVWDLGVLVGLLVYAAHYAPLSEYQSKYWLHRTFDLGPREWYQTGNSTDDDPIFYVVRPSNTAPIDIIALASSYIIISGGHHLFVAIFWPVYKKRGPYALRRMQEVSRWVDYTITPSLILVALSVLFGADNYVALVFAPILLAVLLALSADLEPAPRTTPITSYSPRKLIADTKLSTFNLLFLIPPYLLVWVPVVVSTVLITTKSGVSAPDFVWVFLAIIFLLFAVFPVIYFINPVDREKFYMIASLASKTSAHWFVGVTAINQSNMIGVGADDESGNTDDAQLWIGTAGGIGFPILLCLIARYWFESEPPKSDGSEVSIPLMERESS
jgi:hypothetical protein